jgi:hypothetical protein
MDVTPVLIEKLNNLVSQLPQNSVQEVVDFAGYLLDKENEPSSPAQTEDDPAMQIIGLFDSGIDDLAENHDKYLEDFYARDNNT